MKFAWKFALSAMLAGGQIAAGATLFANESDTKVAAPAKALTVGEEGKNTDETNPETFEAKFKAAMDVARTGGDAKLPTPDRYAKAVELIDEAWQMDRTADETKQAIRMKFSLLMAIGRNSDELKENAKQYLNGLLQDNDPEVAFLAESMLLSLKLSQLSSLPAEEQAAKLDELQAEILESEPTVRTATLATNIANAISYLPEEQKDTQKISELAKHFSSVQDEAVQEAASRLFGLSNRLNLVGKPIEINGTMLDGKDLNFPAAYEGKVVLVDFWATWCGPCVAEIPNMKKLYEVYHPHGFEIVGISLDSEREQLDEFVQTREIPWPIVWNQREEGESGWIDPNAERYGISGIPTMILVGKDGNVISLSARGHNLGQLLAEAYPDVEVPAQETSEPAVESK
ncbi:hypothetical protein C5Y96_06515 [Blastopirellula marina]|uniref:Thioredoxin domain-containing protein n=1 Tax=Blastopirellula marina TaxID=124 RepID=A0A2S8FXA6_9BACT|nr:MULTISPECIES: TlpA disulfide reductase family protein [Pirellulaceae]PQO36816.1 hypothetical protein C5Y96_06515 [Blastopirellula marina]RCS53531.1 TlpA family protein disulfide reductase [Bremerella cremea]